MNPASNPAVPASDPANLNQLLREGSALLGRTQCIGADTLESEIAAAEAADSPTPVDVPGVGACVTDARGVPFLLGSSPEPLLGMLRKEEKREALLIRLLFAARDLATSDIERLAAPFVESAGGAELSQLFRCRKCHRVSSIAVGSIRHTKRCRVARVFALLDELFVSKPVKSARHCPACGTTDDAWVTQEKPAAEIDLSMLDMNQAVSVETHDGLRTVHSHLCASELDVKAATAVIA